MTAPLKKSAPRSTVGASTSRARGSFDCAASARVSAGRTNSDCSFWKPSIRAGSTAGSGWSSYQPYATMRSRSLRSAANVAHHLSRGRARKSRQQRQRAISHVLVRVRAHRRGKRRARRFPPARDGALRAASVRTGWSRELSCLTAAWAAAAVVISFACSSAGRARRPRGAHDTADGHERSGGGKVADHRAIRRASGPAAGTPPRSAGMPPDTCRCNRRCSTTTASCRPTRACPRG